ncbi:hypothetical protein JTB14_019235 [Gonioctena quinquepunctata]|nr:hypothetical protein JTB14_019235 [Gonioctena quinquepunctata]
MNEIHGPEPYDPILKVSFGKIMYDSFIGTDSEDHAMVDSSTGRTLSYRNILERTCSLAKALHHYGSGPGSIHAICSGNNLEFPIPLIACFYLGCTVVPWNPLFTKDELNFQLDLTKPNIIFCSEAVHAKLLKCNRKCIEKIIVIDSTTDFPGTESLETFMKFQLRGISVSPYDFQPIDGIDPSHHVALIMSSSGTTGLPKGVMITHGNLSVRVAQAM